MSYFSYIADKRKFNKVMITNRHQWECDNNTPEREQLLSRVIGEKQYELKDHLGNVRAVITDRKLYDVDTDENTAEVASYNNYYPFGMLMPGFNYNAKEYRFGFNGKEMDNDFSDGITGAVYDYGFRIYDARIARFLSIDPLTKDYPWYTPYQFAGNKPICAIDLDGLEEYYVIFNIETGKETKVDIKTHKEVIADRIYKIDDDHGPLGDGFLFQINLNGRLYSEQYINSNKEDISWALTPKMGSNESWEKNARWEGQEGFLHYSLPTMITTTFTIVTLGTYSAGAASYSLIVEQSAKMKVFKFFTSAGYQALINKEVDVFDAFGDALLDPFTKKLLNAAIDVKFDLDGVTFKTVFNGDKQFDQFIWDATLSFCAEAGVEASQDEILKYTKDNFDEFEKYFMKKYATTTLKRAGKEVLSETQTLSE